MSEGASGSHGTTIKKDFGWTAGHQQAIRHRRRIDIGGFGEVHEVFPVVTSLIVDDSYDDKQGSIHRPLT